MAKIRIEVCQEETEETKYKICKVIHRGLDAGCIVVYGNRISQYKIFNFRGSDAALFGSVNSIIKSQNYEHNRL